MARNEAEILLKLRDEFSQRLQEAQRNLDQLAAKSRTSATATQQAMGRTRDSIAEASAAARGLASELGIRIPEALTRAASRSAAIGPLLTSAFSAVAVLGLVTAIKQLPAALEDAKGALTGWDDAAKKAYDSQISLNDKYVDRLKTTQRELENMAVAAQKAAVAATPPGLPEGSVPARFSAYAALGRMLGFGTEAEANQKAAQDRANAAALAATANMGKPELSQLAQALAGVADAQDKISESNKRLAKSAVDARLETEALYRALGFVRPPEGSIRGTLDFRDLLGRGMPSIPAIGTETEAFFSSLDFAGAAAGAQAAKDRAREFANSQAEIVGDVQLQAAKLTFDRQKKLADDFAQSFSNSLGAVWDDMFIRGKNVFASLANFAASIGNSIGRSFFQAIGSRILGGASGTGGLVGLASKIPGIGGILGGGGAFAGGASVLGSTAVAGGVLAPAAAPMVIGGTGAAAAAGGASILGMSTAVAIPVIGAIAAGAIFGLSRLFRHRPEAEFTADPFANQKSRTYEFYAMDVNRRLADALDRFTSKYDPVDAGKILQSARSRRAMRDAIRTSQSEDPGWSMDTGAAFNGAL